MTPAQAHEPDLDRQVDPRRGGQGHADDEPRHQLDRRRGGAAAEQLVDRQDGRDDHGQDDRDHRAVEAGESALHVGLVLLHGPGELRPQTVESSATRVAPHSATATENVTAARLEHLSGGL